MKVLNLIIASENEPYYHGLMIQWRRYMNIHPDIKSWFIRFESNLSEPYVFDTVSNTLWMRGIEAGLTIYDKTARAIQICFEQPEYSTVEYIIRTNLSSFYIWDRVLTVLSKAPKQRFITGRIITQCDNVPYPSGCGMIMTRDVAELWAYNQDTPERYYISDDWAFGYTLQRAHLTITPADCYMIPDHDIIIKFKEVIIGLLPDACYHIRVKAGTEEHRLNYEVSNYTYLVDQFYGSSK